MRPTVTYANLPIWFGVVFGCSNLFLSQLSNDSWLIGGVIAAVSVVGGYTGGRLGLRILGKGE